MLKASTLSLVLFFEASLTEEELQASPMCINTMKLLRYAEQHGGIQITKLGNFYRKCVEWSAEEFQWPGYEPAELYAVNKVLNEPDFPPLFLIHEILLNARLIRHYKGRAKLTKAGSGMIGQYGDLQVALTEYMLRSPIGDDPQANSLFWNLEHILRVIGSRLTDWTTVGELSELAIPTELFPPRGSLSGRFEACLFVAHEIVRPLSWLGLLEDGNLKQRPHVRLEERLVRKTALFDRFVRLIVPTADAGQRVH
ncbi:hypothetical protein [Sinorhizobium fredii]|uniref:hypothetical protein n=1 Tax=Rhizobium fredii TaxID=380 RepID=UPI0012FE7387|nr:hypothetical protein [Sinorhizobium fredii]